MIGLIIAFSILTFLFALLSASTIFVIMASLFTIAVASTGALTEIMIKLGRWKWASSTEEFDDGSSLTTIKMSVAAAWSVGLLLCMFCVFVMILVA